MSLLHAFMHLAVGVADKTYTVNMNYATQISEKSGLKLGGSLFDILLNSVNFNSLGSG